MSLTITQTHAGDRYCLYTPEAHAHMVVQNYIVNFNQATQLGFLFSHAARPAVLFWTFVGVAAELAEVWCRLARFCNDTFKAMIQRFPPASEEGFPPSGGCPFTIASCLKEYLKIPPF